MRKVFVVRSTDGIIGVYSTIKRAFGVAILAIGGDGVVLTPDMKNNKIVSSKATYRKATIRFKNSYYFELNQAIDHDISATIELFYLNQFA